MTCFLDNSSMGSIVVNSGLYAAGAGGFTVGGHDTATDHFDGHLDDIAFFANTYLTPDERDEINRNHSAPAAPGQDPSITLDTNLTANINSTENPYFFSIDSIGDVVNTTTSSWTINLYLNDSLNVSIYTTTNLNTSIYTLNLTYGDEEAGYDINVTLNNSDLIDSFVRANVFIDSVVPSISQTVVNNNTFLYRNLDSLITPFLTGTDTNLFAMNFTLFEIINGSRNEVLNNSFIEDLNVTNYTLNYTFDINSLNLSVSRYELFGQIWDSHTNNNVREPQWFTSTDTIHIDNDIEIFGDIKEELTTFLLSPIGDRYKFKITWNTNSNYHNLTIKTNDNNIIYRPDDGYLGHFVILGLNRWIDLENDDINTVTATLVGNNEYFVEIWHDTFTDEIEFESIGDLNSITSSWFFNITDGFTFYAVDGITSNAITNFTVNVLNGSALVQSQSTETGNITFNITAGDYLLNITASGYANNETENVTFSTNGSFTWTLFAENSLYLFFYDERTDLLVDDRNVTAEILGPSSAVNHTTSTGSLFISGFDIGSYEIRYFAPGYQTKSYFTTINSLSTQRIDLYMITNTSSSLILFSLFDEKGTPVFNSTLKALRFFLIDNAYLTVNMEKTDSNGEAGLYLEPNDVYYQFIVDKDGKTIGTFGPQKIFSENVVLPIVLQEDVLTSWNAVRDSISTSLTFDNDTSIVTYTWNDASGITLQGCVYVTEYTSLSTISHGPNCTSSVSATINMNLSNIINNNTFLIEGIISTNTTYSDPVTDILWIDLSEDFKIFGDYGLFLGVFMVATLFFIGVIFSFSFGLILMVVGMLALQLLGIVFFGNALLLTIFIVGLVIAVINRI